MFTVWCAPGELPWAFSILINDMPYVLDKCSATLFADDTPIYFTSSNISELRNILQSELLLLLDWICENRLVLNVAKTKIYITVKSSFSNNNQLCLSLKDLDVERVQEPNLLGVTLNEQLSWEKHIEDIVKKVSRGISRIRRCSSFLIPACTVLVTRALVYLALIAAAVWSGAAKTDLSKQV